MTDGDTSPDDASDTAGSGRAHGTAEPRAPFPTVMERVWAHNREKLRQWSLAHPAPSPGPPEPDPAAEPDPPVRARASAGAQADHPDRPGVLRWLPASLQRLYRRLAEAVPYARNTRPRPIPPDDERPSSGQARQYRLEIAYDAFCGHRPPPKKLFRANPWRRDLTSWCDAPNSWTDRRKPRCHHCERARAHYIAACRGDWKAEVALYKLARRGAVRLLAERRQYREQRRQFWARHREHVARNGPEPMPPQFEPELWPMIAHRGSHESWHHRDRRAVERGLVRAHARHLRRETQRRRERLRDLEAAVGCKSAQRALHQTDVDDATSAPPPEPRHCEDPGAAGVRGNPGPRDRRMRRGPGSPRRQTAARDDDGRETGLSEPTADAAPAPDAPAQPPGSDGDKPAQARVSLRPPPADPTIKIGAARSAIPQPLRDAGATRQVQNHPSGAASVPSGQAGTLARDAADRSVPADLDPDAPRLQRVGHEAGRPHAGERDALGVHAVGDELIGDDLRAQLRQQLVGLGAAHGAGEAGHPDGRVAQFGGGGGGDDGVMRRLIDQRRPRGEEHDERPRVRCPGGREDDGGEQQHSDRKRPAHD